MFLQDLQATFRVISCNPSTWLGWIVARQPPLSQCFVHFYLTTLGHGGSAFPVSLTNHTDLCAGFDRAGMVTLIVKLSSHRLHAQMRETKCLVPSSWFHGWGWGGGCYPFLHGILGCQVKGTRQVQAPVGPGKRRPGKVEPIFFTVQMAMATCWNMLKKYVKLLPPGKQRWQWKAHHV